MKTAAIVMLVLLVIAIGVGFALYLQHGASHPVSGDLSARELAAALDTRWWTMTIPEGMEGKTLGLRYKTTSGVESGGGSSGWLAGEKVKVFIHDLQSERIHYAVVGARATLTGSFRNRLLQLDGCVTQVPVGTEVRPGQVLVKKSREDGVNIGNEVREGETGLVFTFD